MDDLQMTEPSKHIGRKIGSVRRLVGLSQTALGERLGMTKQAVSKLEQTENIDEKRLKKIAEALGVTEDGLKKYNSERVLYFTNNFYENSNAKIESGLNGHVENINSFSIEQAVKLFEELIKIEKAKFDKVQGTKK
ncbi:Helix-turn-helix [Arachidicoccus rhizosphaerae]|uniref:Helix-turn-helix n=1 Tax=Arachidicoccus rhizosphaerae TaxID=551991 RepID=A0A1H3ZWY8_9BACT|nr:helix-turn-helix transcriptional regulator [Arachidicoccus rhizosphaerae]SEA28158.1 Helix-turn-helix [Arachidicoccus rhizosphaerae]